MQHGCCQSSGGHGLGGSPRARASPAPARGHCSSPGPSLGDPTGKEAFAGIHLARNGPKDQAVDHTHSKHDLELTSVPGCCSGLLQVTGEAG